MSSVEKRDEAREFITHARRSAADSRGRATIDAYNVARVIVDEFTYLSYQVGYWLLGEKGGGRKPDIFDIYSGWGKLRDYVDSTDVLPVEIPPQLLTVHGEDASDGLLSLEDLRRQLHWQAGFLESLEFRLPDRYQRVLSEQVEALIAKILKVCGANLKVADFEDDPTLGHFAIEIADDRDLLEYGLSGLAVLQLNTPGRLPDIHTTAYVRQLHEQDRALRQFFRTAKRAGWSVANASAPKVFWWRHI